MEGVMLDNRFTSGHSCPFPCHMSCRDPTQDLHSYTPTNTERYPRHRWEMRGCMHTYTTRCH